jgi:hypothetical protein
VDGTVESEVGLALARALGGQREGLLLWHDAVLAGVLINTSVGGGLYFGTRQLVRAVAAEWLVDGPRSQQLRQICSAPSPVGCCRSRSDGASTHVTHDAESTWLTRAEIVKPRAYNARHRPWLRTRTDRHPISPCRGS